MNTGTMGRFLSLNRYNFDANGTYHSGRLGHERSLLCKPTTRVAELADR